MNNVKITVLDTTLNKALTEEYAVPGLTKCPFLKPGMEFISEGGAKPSGLCEDAWVSMCRYVLVLAFGTKNLWEDWMKDDGTAILCCNDACRPVYFKLESI